MGGGIMPAKAIDDRLLAKGFVLLGIGPPIVLVAVDWCEIRNDAYDRWRTVLADAVGTSIDRVMVTSGHQHDTPISDLTAQRILDDHHAKGSICDLAFHERAVKNVAESARKSLTNAVAITHFGTGIAKVEGVASNRRYLGDDGKPMFNRMSATRDAAIREKPEGIIDPWLRMLSFWNGERCLVALSCYATHPMSHYGAGRVSYDFIGQARERLQRDDPRVFQLYTSGCSGNIAAGKYNDGSDANRKVLADRIYHAMTAATKNTQRIPIKSSEYRVVKLHLEPRATVGFSKRELEKKLSDSRPFQQCLAALGLSWRKRLEQGRPIDVPVLDLGQAQLLLLPGESYIEYQLFAQETSPDTFVVTMGYGESATGYIPTDQHFDEGDSNLHDWCWVARGSESRMKQAIRNALHPIN
jgi:hypothetical protein